MEAFKICEKETKTKAYSKEGLARARELDPEDKKRKETRDWLTEKLEAIKQMIEEAEAELEAAAASSSRASRRRRSKSYRLARRRRNSTNSSSSTSTILAKLRSSCACSITNGIHLSRLMRSRMTSSTTSATATSPSFTTTPTYTTFLTSTGTRSPLLKKQKSRPAGQASSSAAAAAAKQQQRLLQQSQKAKSKIKRPKKQWSGENGGGAGSNSASGGSAMMNGGLGVVGGVGANASFGAVIPDAGKLIRGASGSGRARAGTEQICHTSPVKCRPYGSYYA